MGTGWSLAGSSGIHVVLDRELHDLPAAVERINASEPRVRASADGTHIRVVSARPMEWSGVPVHYGRRPRFEGTLVQGPAGEPMVEGSIIRSDAAQVFAVFGCLIAVVAFVAGLLVVADGDAAGFVSIAASFVIAAAMLATVRLQQRLADADARTIVDAIGSLGACASS